MASPSRTGLRDKAVYYAYVSDDEFGERTVSAGVEIKARWEIVDSQTLNAQDKVIKTEATVFVDRDIPIGSLLWNGKLKDLPSPVTDLYEVVSFNKTQDMRKRLEPTRWVKVRKFADSLPTVV